MVVLLWLAAAEAEDMASDLTELQILRLPTRPGLRNPSLAGATNPAADRRASRTMGDTDMLEQSHNIVNGLRIEPGRTVEDRREEEQN